MHHFGTLSKGHYVAHVCEGGRWFLCDDASVTAVTEQEVAATAQTGSPYILFYVRRRFSPSKSAAASGLTDSPTEVLSTGRKVERWP